MKVIEPHPIFRNLCRNRPTRLALATQRVLYHGSPAINQVRWTAGQLVATADYLSHDAETEYSCWPKPQLQHRKGPPSTGRLRWWAVADLNAPARFHVGRICPHGDVARTVIAWAPRNAAESSAISATRSA